MPKSLLYKCVFIAAVLIACIVSVTGWPGSAAELAANWNRNIRLGLDLKGGAHFILGVEIEDAWQAEADELAERLKTTLSRQKAEYNSVDRRGADVIVTSANTSTLRQAVQAEAGTAWLLASTSTSELRLTLRPEAREQLRRDTMAQTIGTMERKISALGVAEASVQQRGGSGGESEILIQLPGVDDPARVKSILQTTAQLELCLVRGGPYATRDQAYLDQGGVLPLGTKLVPGAGRATDNGGESWWLTASSPVVRGRDIRDARAQQSDRPGQWDTAFVLSQDAARRFARFTETHIGQRLAIVVDKVVVSAPVVESRIEDQGRILGMPSQQAAADLAINLRAGSLPASVKVLSERLVGPSLGADSIRRGVSAGLLGLALVIASMLIYYRGAGWNAVLALLLNTILTVAALSWIDATWTLPGIAGLVLSIGMAVDSNVLIFERIKEELRAGRGVPSAIAAGFDRALVTIIDTHVTTVVASAFLFIFGTGPVRGFAVTLVIGLLANLFTAVFVSRVLFDAKLWRNPGLDRLSIGQARIAAERKSIDFLSRRKLTIGLSLAAIAVSLVTLLWHGPNYGLDFRGGTLMYVRIDPKPPIEEVRRLLPAQLDGAVSVQETRGTGEFIIGTGLADEASLEKGKDAVLQAFRAHYANHRTFELRSVDLVGPRAGAQMRQQALYATIGAFGGMLAFIAWRFQWISGAAAILATLHDVLITAGLLSITGREIDLNIIAALLTLIGYSMNDKIVVFDRVRENRAKLRGAPLMDLVNLSINQTLSRTLLTAGPTLLACLALYFLGGDVLNGIAFALFAGIVAGTYSSIFVASALLVMWDRASTHGSTMMRT